ncbi:MAG: CARDB domain-containing protein [Solirubrobacterales bacterium]
MEDFASRRPPRRERPRRRPERQQIMLRRGLALGGGLILLILIVLGVKGCLDARAESELSDYADKVSEIGQETEQTSKDFFGNLENQSGLSVTEFTAKVHADASAMDGIASRVDSLGAPGDMNRAQQNLELTYELRANAMTEIAEKMSTALGNAGAEKAMTAITRQMQKLFAADVVYEQVVRPEIDGVLAAKGISGHDAPKSTFIPDEKWLEAKTVSSALGAISGNSASAGPGLHGLGLIGVSVNGTELVEGGGATTIAGEEGVEVEVTVQNQGESTENGVNVSVTVEGNTLQGEIEEIAAGEEATVTIPLTPAPKGEVTLEVEAEPVPGEHFAENNEATYTLLVE